ncbi:MAG: hypothetical protein Roseis2KO_15160 [Roseivirga sp.]
MTDAGNLYDRLFSFESKKRKHPYPIHKRLRLDDSSPDLIDWLVQKLHPSPGKSVLDAGCGCGYTLFKLADSGIKGAGVSLSSKEIDFANEYALAQNLSDRLKFSVQSYDEKMDQSFDYIFAIESLKHSPAPHHTIANLLAHLKTDRSVLVIADDFFLSNSKTKKQQDKLWVSPNSLTDQELNAAIKASGGKVMNAFDLSDRVATRNRVLLNWMVNVFSLIYRIRKTQGLAIYLGGLILERAYTRQQCRYKVLFITKDPNA